MLKSGGGFHIADFGQPHTIPARLTGLAMGYFEQVADNIAGFIPVMLQGAGFVDVQVEEQQMMVFGTLSLYRARKPEVDHAAPAS